MPDPEHLAALHARCFVVPRPWTAQDFAELLKHPRVFLLGDSNAFLIGQTVLDEAELLTLAVSPELRRAGQGRGLLGEFLTQSAERGAERAFLEVAADNFPALALYRSSGFAQVGSRKGYYSAPDGRAIDALVLSRPI